LKDKTRTSQVLEAIVWIWVAALCLSPTVTAAAQDSGEPAARAEPSVRFSHVSTKDGLSQSVVTAILQDSHGFVWIGTEGGLNRYDGYEFTVYQYDPHNPNSLSDNHVTDLYEDSGGKLWVATHGGGVNRFDPRTETFTRYQHEPENPNSLAGNVIFSIFQDSRGNLWFGGPPDTGDLTRFDPTAGTFTRYPAGLGNANGFQRGAIWDVIEDESGTLWLAADFVLARFDPETEQFAYFAPDTEDRRLATLYQDEVGMLWLGGSKGLYRFDPQTGDFTLYQPGHATLVQDILPNDDGTLWIGTQGSGLYLFDPQAGQFTHHYVHDLGYEDSLSHDQVFDLYQDRAGVLWIGTEEGLNLYDPRQSQFAHYRHDLQNPNSLADGAVWGIAGDEGGGATSGDSVWIGTGLTLNRLDLVHGQVTRYALETDESSPQSTTTGAIYCDPAGFVWAGKGAMLYHLDRASGEITAYNLQTTQPPGSPPMETSAFYYDGASVLWIGLLRGGIVRFDLQNGTFQPYLEPPPESRGEADPRFLLNQEVTTIYGDRAGNIWIGYATGQLSRLDPNAETFQHYVPAEGDPHNISGGEITGIYQDQAGLLWLGSQRGLTRFDPHEETFTLYTERDGLPSAYVTGIQQDRNGDLWLATMKGLSRFDPQTGTFHNYDVEDGVGSTEFLGSSWQSADGRIFFGGRNGLTTFYPDQIQDDLYEPPIVLTGFYLFNEPVAVGEGSLLQQPIWDTDHLTLQHDQTWISFEFAVLSYTAPRKDHYRYILEGVDETWTEVAGDHRLATYTHLPPGEYLFRVQGSNEDGIWSDEEIGLPITIVPAWWQTWWFRGSALLLLLGLVVAGIRWRLSALQRRGHILEAEVAERTRELAAHAERLQESEERFATVMNSLQSLMYAADMETYELLFVNQAVRDIFGDVEGAICWQILQKDRTGPCDFCTNKYLLKDGRPTGIYTWEFQNTSTGRWHYIQDRAIRWIDGRWVRLEVATDITERKQAERELEESEKRFREMTELLPGAVIEMDAEFVITYLNRSGLENLGYSEQDIQAGLNAMELLHPLDRERAARHMASSLEGEDNPPTEYLVLRKDGTEVPVLFKAAPIRREGEIRGFRASVTDISNLKEAEKAVRQSEQQLRFITDSVPAYVAYVGLDDLRYRFVSRKFEQAYKLPRESIIGKHIKDVIGESNYQFALKYIDEVRSGRAISYENVFDIAEGKRWIEVNYVPTFDERGEPEGIAVLSFDITERKRAEEALRESQEQFALFMDMLPHGVFIKEEDSTVIYVNQYIKDVLGGEHWLGRDAYAAFPEYPELAEAMMADDRSAFAQGQTRVEEAMPDKDGNERVFVTTKFRIPRTNKPSLLGGIGLDITDRVKAERKLAAALDTARQLRDEAEAAQRASEAASRAKSIFLANMSHELRTPLNAILGYSQLMARDPHVTPTQQEYLGTIARSGEHLLGLINNVLTMSKVEAGRATLQENAFDLHQQLLGLQEMFHMRAQDKGLTLCLDIAPDVPRYVYADEGKLRQVLMNLLSNAVKFTEEGGVTLRVKADRDRDREAVQDAPPLSPTSICFEVEDTGAGIAPQEMEALFEPFVQTASGQQSREGTGLGLPISQQFVKLMGGKLGVSSIVGHGTTFRVQIPVALVTEGAVETLGLQPRQRVTGIEPDQTAPDGGSFRLLVVEDKATNRELLIKLLEPFGFDVRSALNGAEGVEMWKAWQPHLVWMDMRMPVMDGYEATRQIKARAAAIGRPAIVVALTASAFEEDREAILAAGCDDFVRKPFREHDILNVLHRHLGVRFVYETITPAPDVATAVSLEELRASAETLPATWATDLYQAIIALDIDRMLALIEAVRPQVPHLADTLAQWVRNFEYEKLLALLG
jgi:PAS domain S-box-containing protein